MSQLKVLFADHAITWIIGLFFSAMTYLVNNAVKSIIKTQKLKQSAIKAESLEQDQIKEGLVTLLRFRIGRIYDAVKNRGSITTDERYDLSYMFHTYEALGGNGKTKMMVDFLLEKYDIQLEDSEERLENLQNHV